MTIENSGTVEFWFDPAKNPFAFKDGNNVKWIEFKVDNEIGVIISEGKTLTGIMNPNTAKELQIFQTSIEFDLSKRHQIALTWQPQELCLYFDGKLQQKIDPSDFG